jgi:hypothetical protein
VRASNSPHSPPPAAAATGSGVLVATIAWASPTAPHCRYFRRHVCAQMCAKTVTGCNPPAEGIDAAGPGPARHTARTCLHRKPPGPDNRRIRYSTSVIGTPGVRNTWCRAPS